MKKARKINNFNEALNDLDMKLARYIIDIFFSSCAFHKPSYSFCWLMFRYTFNNIYFNFL